MVTTAASIAAPKPRLKAQSIIEFCKRYGVGRTYVYEEIRNGRLVAKKAGRRTLIADEEGERWFAALPPVRSSNPWENP